MAGAGRTRLNLVGRVFVVYATIDAVHRSVNSPPPIPQWPPIVDVLNVAVDDALHERTSVDEALRRAAEAARGILKGPA